MEQTFDQYLGQARNQFVNAINAQEWNTKMRTEAENLLIAFDQMRAKVKQFEWIEAKDRLPEMRKTKMSNLVITVDNNLRHRVLAYDYEFKGWTTLSSNIIITHWMPLPEKPNK